MGGEICGCIIGERAAPKGSNNYTKMTGDVRNFYRFGKKNLLKEFSTLAIFTFSPNYFSPIKSCLYSNISTRFLARSPTMFPLLNPAGISQCLLAIFTVLF